MSGIALGILCLCLVGGAVFTVLWARRNKRNMKASYPGELISFDNHISMNLIIYNLTLKLDQFSRQRFPTKTTHYGSTGIPW